MIYSKLGSSATTQDFEEDYSTPEYKLYEDDDGDGNAHAKECDDEPTLITYDTYIGAEVVVPKGNNMDFKGQQEFNICKCGIKRISQNCLH